MNIYLYYVDLEKPCNLVKLSEGKETANELFEIE